MIKISDKRAFTGALAFEDIEFGKPFYFLPRPDRIFVLVTDDTVAEITDNFFAYDPKDFDNAGECLYVNLEIAIT